MAVENSRFPDEMYVRSISASDNVLSLSRVAQREILPGKITAAQFVLPSTDEFDLHVIGSFAATILGTPFVNRDAIQVDNTKVFDIDRKFAHDFGKVDDPSAGYEIRTIVNAVFENEEIKVIVGPALIHEKHPLARANATALHIPEAAFNDQSERYIRLRVDDHAGVLVQIAHIFGENQINIVGVVQHEFEKDEKGNRIRDDVDIAFLLRPALHGNSAAALADIGNLKVVRAVDAVFPVFR